jgi:hypothetical protein
MLQQDSDELYDRLEVDVSDDAALELQHVQVVVDAVVLSVVVVVGAVAAADTDAECSCFGTLSQSRLS